MDRHHANFGEQEGMNTRKNLSGTTRQMELKKKHKLTNLQFEQMLEMLADLTPAEIKTLEYPDFITEDEADLIVSDRRMKEEGDKAIPLSTVLKNLGIPPRRRKSA
jgi:hypothetical protein